MAAKNKSSQNSDPLYETVRVRKLEDYISFVRKQQAIGHTSIYRGQSRDFPLLPNVARFREFLDDEDVSDIEQSLYTDFCRGAVSFRKDIPANDWEVLAMAQHHGLPTRLMDWSRNPLVALWFSVASRRSDEGESVVWVHEPDDDDYVAPKELSASPFKLQRYVVFEPSHATPRIRAQDGVFTAHPISTRGTKPFDTTGRHRSCMKKIIVPGSIRENLLYDLEYLGFHQSSIFPDLDGLTQKIVNDHDLWDVH